MLVDTADLLDTQAVCALTGLRPSTVRGYVSRGYLPPPILRLAGGPVWHRPDVVRWWDARPGRGRPRKVAPTP